MALGSDANQPVTSPGNLGAADTANRNGVIFEAADRAEDGGAGSDGVYTSEELHNFGARGVDIFINTTSTGTGTVTVKLQKKDPASGTWFDIAGATSAAVADDADAYFTVYPGIAETANVSISDHIGLIWRAHATVATANVTFSVGAVYLR